MTQISPFWTPAPPGQASSATGRALTTGMSFAEALRAADAGTNRMFGFGELGMFGRSAATKSALSAATLPDKTHFDDATSSGATMAADTAAAAGMAANTPGRASRETIVGGNLAPQQLRSLPAAHGRSQQGRHTAAEADFPQYSASGEPSATESERSALGRPALPRTPSRSPGEAGARLIVAIDGDEARIVARDFGLTEEDRAILEERADDLLRAHGISRAELTLNGQELGAGQTYRKED